MRMGKFSKLALVAVVGALLAPMAQADVRNSKHNLGSGANSGANGTPPNTSADTTEVCVFCHTPHGSNTGVEAPLWNKTIPSNTYQRYSELNSVTLDGAEVAVGSVSLACLSCHDGTQAMDVLVNEPGSGGWNDPTGAPVELNPGDSLSNMTGSPIPMLGTDLRDDHPISIAYAGGGCETLGGAACSPVGGDTADPDFQDAEYASINGVDQWWVDTSAGVGGTREKADIILFTRDFSGSNGPSVECASCHDPHEEAVRPVSFMRLSNDNSEVCLSCHIK